VREVEAVAGAYLYDGAAEAVEQALPVENGDRRAPHMNADATLARMALEEVCARGDLDLAQECYADDFVDHVNAVDLHGRDGIRRSTGLYRALFDDLQIRVLDQITEGDRVVSRWVMTGSNRGRPVEMSGITISRMEAGRIVEDWSALDSLELLRQLGLVRTVLAAPQLLCAMASSSGHVLV
jgi:predicted ester cyclase